ncbi:regulatory protein, luxR family [Burkholderia sp. D7]|nr:regulatory protein, luxR family [Burkholderia sp. D7]
MDVRTIDLHEAPASSSVSIATDLIGRVGEPGYAEQLTDSLSQVIRFAHLCVLSFSRRAPPRLLGTGSTLSPACAEDTACVYLGGHYNADPTGQLRNEKIASSRRLYLQRQRAEDIANADYRASCYEKPGIVDRLSLFQHVDPDTWIAINLYRDASQGHFDGSEYAHLMTMAPILTASADKHRQLIAKKTDTAYDGLRERPPASQTLQQRLAASCPILSAREFEVCSWILLGLSAKEIARQLGVAPTTVAEHRKNAYTKLAIHNHKQLFARFAT